MTAQRPVGAPLTDVLAVYRLTRLATTDALLNRPRELVASWSYSRRSEGYEYPLDDDSPTPWADWAMDDPKAPKLATLVTCRWCASAWIGLGVVAARRLFPRAWPPVAKALAYSAVAVWLGRLED